MKLRMKYADQIVGAFVLLAIGGIVAILFSLAINQRVFSHNVRYHSRFASANSLAVGTGIAMRGFEIGKISKVWLDKDNLVDIEFYVYEEYKDKVTQNSVLELSVSPIGLGNSLLFHRGRSINPLLEDSYVPSLDTKEGQELVRANLVEIPKKDDTITRLLSNVNTVLENVNETVLTLNETFQGKGKGPIRDIVNNANVALVSLNKTIVEVQSTLDNIGGKVGNVLDQTNAAIPQTLDKVDELVTQVKGLLDQTNGIIANLTTMSESFKDPTGLVTKLIDPKGSVKTLLDDNGQLWSKLTTMLDSLNQSVQDINKITSGVSGEVPKLSSMLMETRKTIASAQDVLEGLKNNPLLKGGISEKPQQQSLFQNVRKEEF